MFSFDSDWNPHADLQAQDRAHRIGQTRAPEPVLKATDRPKSTEIPSKLSFVRLTLHVGPEPLNRGRFNSLDSRFILNNPTAQKSASARSNIPPVRAQTPTSQLSEPEPASIQERARSATPSAGMFFRSTTPTIVGLLAPPSQNRLRISLVQLPFALFVR
jgi:hypothetical protein